MRNVNHLTRQLGQSKFFELIDYCVNLCKKEKPKEEKEEKPVDDKKPKSEKRFEYEFKFGKSFGDGKSKFNFGGPPRSSGSPEDTNKYVSYAIIAGLSFLGYIAYNELKYKEITWKEFINNYLSRGAVEKLEVINKKWVRVKLAPGNQIDGSNVLWFNIGSVDTFERNLENIQLEMNIEPQNYVPVVYKTEMDGSNLLSLIPTLLILAAIIWSVRRSAGMISGRGAGRRGGIFGIGETTAKLINPSDIGVSFK